MEKKILFIGNESCEPCIEALKVVKKVANENKIGVEVVNSFSKLKEYESEKLYDIIEKPAIPTICVIKDNNIEKCIVGYSDNFEEELKEILK